MYVTVLFFKPTIEVITFNLRWWCMLGVILLPAFICLGHECQDLLSLCDGMHVHRLDLGILYSHPKSFWRMESKSMLTPREKSPLRGGSNPWRCIKTLTKPYNNRQHSQSYPSTHIIIQAHRGCLENDLVDLVNKKGCKKEQPLSPLLNITKRPKLSWTYNITQSQNSKSAEGNPSQDSPRLN